MIIRIINQPDISTTGDEIISGLAEESYQAYDTFIIICAYARKSGIKILREHLSRFREEGGQVKAIIGVDNRITSIEALQMIMELTDESHIFHNENIYHTFHPKMYILQNEDSAKVIIGSGNLTKGGLSTNNEIGSVMELDLSNHDDKCVFESVEEGIQSITQSGEQFYKILDENLLTEMISRKIIIPGQRQHVQKRSISSRTEPLFGSRAPQRLIISHRQSIASINGNQEGFWKVLSNSDVSLGSSPGQIIIPIRFLGLFPSMDELRITDSGGKQSDVFFDVIVKLQDGTRIEVEGSRLVRYVPAPNHPRQNHDLRFTFRNTEVKHILEAGSILKFQRTNAEQYWFLISIIPANSPEYQTLAVDRTRYDFL